MSKTVADAFVKGWVCRFGSPKLMHQDNGAEFTSKLFKQVCSLLDMQRTTTTPYYPQSNGMVERVNQTLQNLLKCVCTEAGKNWTEMVPYALSAYRASRHNSTGYSPNKLVFGREASAPLDLEYGRPAEMTLCHKAYVQWMTGCMAYTHGRT